MLFKHMTLKPVSEIGNAQAHNLSLIEHSCHWETETRNSPNMDVNRNGKDDKVSRLLEVRGLLVEKGITRCDQDFSKQDFSKTLLSRISCFESNDQSTIFKWINMALGFVGNDMKEALTIFVEIGKQGKGKGMVWEVLERAAFIGLDCIDKIIVLKTMRARHMYRVNLAAQMRKTGKGRRMNNATTNNLPSATSAGDRITRWYGGECQILLRHIRETSKVIKDKLHEKRLSRDLMIKGSFHFDGKTTGEGIGGILAHLYQDIPGPKSTRKPKYPINRHVSILLNILESYHSLQGGRDFPSNQVMGCAYEREASLSLEISPGEEETESDFIESSKEFEDKSATGVPSTIPDNNIINHDDSLPNMSGLGRSILSSLSTGKKVRFRKNPKKKPIVLESSKNQRDTSSHGNDSTIYLPKKNPENFKKRNTIAQGSTRTQTTKKGTKINSRGEPFLPSKQSGSLAEKGGRGYRTHKRDRNGDLEDRESLEDPPYVPSQKNASGNRRRRGKRRKVVEDSSDTGEDYHDYNPKQPDYLKSVVGDVIQDYELGLHEMINSKSSNCIAQKIRRVDETVSRDDMEYEIFPFPLAPNSFGRRLSISKVKQIEDTINKYIGDYLRVLDSLTYRNVLKEEYNSEYARRLFYRQKRLELESKGFTLFPNVLKSNISAFPIGIDSVFDYIEGNFRDNPMNSNKRMMHRTEQDSTKLWSTVVDCQAGLRRDEKPPNQRKHQTLPWKTNHGLPLEIRKEKFAIDVLLGYLIRDMYPPFGETDLRIRHFAFPPHGSNYLRTSEGAAADEPHCIFPPVEPDGLLPFHQPPPLHSMFMMYSGKQPFALRVWPTSHIDMNVDTSEPSALDHIGRGMSSKLEIVPPYSVFIGRGDLLHADASGEELQKAFTTYKGTESRFRGNGEDVLLNCSGIRYNTRGQIYATRGDYIFETKFRTPSVFPSNVNDDNTP